MKAFRFPPELWAEVEQHIPRGERTALLVECLRREVNRRKRKDD